MSIQNIAVIGAGTMGNGIAHVFAQSGFNVTLVDVAQAQLDRALSTIDANLARQVKKGTLTEEDQKATIGRIQTDTSIANAAKNADFIVEAATERFDLKTKIFAELDGNAKEGVILATNTSSISVTRSEERRVGK